MATLINQDHRPWPAPARYWSLAMRWHDLLFMHWPVAVEHLQPLLPQRLSIDIYEGQAWLGLIPFGMRRVRPRLLPAFPWISHFPEMNLRTYVVAEDKPGVWFFSLDAGNPVAVQLARRFFHLPYFDARMRLWGEGDWIHYQSERTHRGTPRAVFNGRYRPAGPVMTAGLDPLADWLTSRYCLYSQDLSGRIWRGEIDHPAWPLQPAEAEIKEESVIEAAGFPRPEGPPILHFSAYLEVVAWSLEPVQAE